MSILRNSLANFLGGILPSLVLLITIPMMVKGLGIADYGLLTLITAITGYFSIIDINLTAGSVKYVSEYRALGEARRESQTIVLGMVFYLALGLIGALGLFLFSSSLAARVFDIPAQQQEAAASAIRLAAFGFLIAQIQQYLNSLPQAIQRFDVTAKLESVFGVLVPVASVLALTFGAGLYEMIEIRIAGSTLHALALLVQCRRLFPEFRPVMPTREVAARVLSFSGFAYLSKLASLTYAYADKLIIGGLLGMEAVTIYAVPATVINRFLGLTFRLSSVMFPAASQLAAVGEWSRLHGVYLVSTKYITFLNGAIVAIVLLFGHELLHYWIGGVVAERGWPVLVLMGLAMFADSLTNLPSLVNDGLGHARISGLFAISRAILGLAVTWTFAKMAGIAGVAAGHLLASVVLSAAFIAYVHGRSVPYRMWDYLAHGLGAALLVVGLPALLILGVRPHALLGLPVTLLGAALSATLFAALGWSMLLSPTDRADLLRKCRPATAVFRKRPQ